MKWNLGKSLTLQRTASYLQRSGVKDVRRAVIAGLVFVPIFFPVDARRFQFRILLTTVHPTCVSLECTLLILPYYEHGILSSDLVAPFVAP